MREKFLISIFFILTISCFSCEKFIEKIKRISYSDEYRSKKIEIDNKNMILNFITTKEYTIPINSWNSSRITKDNFGFSYLIRIDSVVAMKLLNSSDITAIVIISDAIILVENK